MLMTALRVNKALHKGVDKGVHWVFTILGCAVDILQGVEIDDGRR